MRSFCLAFCRNFRLFLSFFHKTILRYVIKWFLSSSSHWLSWYGENLQIDGAHDPYVNGSAVKRAPRWIKQTVDMLFLFHQMPIVFQFRWFGSKGNVNFDKLAHLETKNEQLYALCHTSSIEKTQNKNSYNWVWAKKNANLNFKSNVCAICYVLRLET